MKVLKEGPGEGSLVLGESTSTLMKKLKRRMTERMVRTMMMVRTRMIPRIDATRMIVIVKITKRIVKIKMSSVKEALVSLTEWVEG